MILAYDEKGTVVWRYWGEKSDHAVKEWEDNDDVAVTEHEITQDELFEILQSDGVEGLVYDPESDDLTGHIDEE